LRPDFRCDHASSSAGLNKSHTNGKVDLNALQRREQVPHHLAYFPVASSIRRGEQSASKRKKVAAMRRYLTLSIAVMLPLLAGAQNPPSASPPTPASPPTSASPTSTPAKSIGMYAYPKNNQSSEQQLKDENDCYGSAKQNSGVDPQAPAPAAPTAEQQQAAQQQAAQQAGKEAPKGGAVAGAAKGAAGGAAVGAIAGDAGTGAGVGATVGAVHGRRQKKKAKKAAEQQAAQQTAQAQQQAQAQATAQHQASLDSFKRAFSACMDARNYSVQ
jgi:Glycine-zipper domain